MHIYPFISAFFVGIAFPLSAVEKPNVLFIAIDDLRPEIGCYGAPQVKTPHIDKLAAQSMRFDRAYCQVPICMGSRASLLTGILPTSKRFVGECRADVDAPDAPTLPETFKKSGYATISNGKIYHNVEDAAKRSWSEPAWKPENSMKSVDPKTNLRLSKSKQRGLIFESPDVADDVYPDGEIAKKTIADLQRLKKDGKPFFLACGFFKPHKGTEKEPRMFGSLVVQLPARHNLGALVVRHRGEEVLFDFGGDGSDAYFYSAAFYANCEHEL
jgi:arylsulfatase A-like enzyme